MQNIDPKLILNVIIAILIYKMAVKAFSSIILRQILNTKTGQDEAKKVKETLEQKLKDKQNAN